MPEVALKEKQEQKLLIATCDRYKVPYPDASLIFAIPNSGGLKGGYDSNGAIVGDLIRSGMRPGIPDLFLPVARGGYNGLFIELKRTHGGSVKEEQSIWHGRLEHQGYLVAIGYGADDAWLMIRNYLDCKYIRGEVNQ